MYARFVDGKPNKIATRWSRYKNKLIRLLTTIDSLRWCQSQRCRRLARRCTLPPAWRHRESWPPALRPASATNPGSRPCGTITPDKSSTTFESRYTKNKGPHQWTCHLYNSLINQWIIHLQFIESPVFVSALCIYVRFLFKEYSHS